MRSSGFGNSLDEDDDEISQFDDSTSFISTDDDGRNGFCLMSEGRVNSRWILSCGFVIRSNNCVS